jgi:hypothetical protein
MSKQPMKIKKAKADAPLWVPQLNEMCEFEVTPGNWTRCVVSAIDGRDEYTVDFEYQNNLSRTVAPIEKLREGQAPASKKDQIVRLLKTGENTKALAMAAKFQDLGEHKAAITKGNNAAKNPDFYRQIKQDPKTLVAAGVEALKARYLE